jgi:cysteine desulfurase family protein (TIGR01976 family)
MTLDINQIRPQFPSLNKDAIFLDNPGGTQIVRSSLDRIERYFLECNANHGGNFATSRQSDALVDSARLAMADFLNASRPEEIVFGANMTTLTFHISRSLGKWCKPGDTIVVTRLDHEGNVSPWLLLAEDLGLKIRWVDINPEDGTLNLEDMQAAIAEKPRLVAFGYASNAIGTVNPVAKITRWAHDAGALVYVDAVQYAPHGPIDVQRLGVDFLVCSAYKFFGPHLGILYGRYDLLESLPAYKVRPAPALPPDKFETGTGNFEHIAGLLGTLEYFEWLGNTFGEEYYELLSGDYKERRLALKQGMNVMRAYELGLSREMLDSFQSIPGNHLYGITDPNKFDQRVPTFSMTIDGWTVEQLAKKLGERNIYTWNGNFYALEISKKLGLQSTGGMLRIGASHYNTIQEIKQTGEALRDIIK